MPTAISEPASTSCTIEVRDYDLAATLDSGQAFRWRQIDEGWEGVVAGKWVRLETRGETIQATTHVGVPDWRWLENYLQTAVNLDHIQSTFPDDEPMRQAVSACRSLRLLKQEKWECLASFILSSTKQILQIRQVVSRLCQRAGNEIDAPNERGPVFGFPGVEAVAGLNEQDLRSCGMGFRAPYLLGSARMIVDGAVRFDDLPAMDLASARAEIMKLPGVGRKIADCALLFSGMQPAAFPVDVWIMKALQQLYFPRRKRTIKQLQQFSESHFGPNAGYAQQYLFHYMRVHGGAPAIVS